MARNGTTQRLFKDLLVGTFIIHDDGIAMLKRCLIHCESGSMYSTSGMRGPDRSKTNRIFASRRLGSDVSLECILSAPTMCDQFLKQTGARGANQRRLGGLE